MSDKADNINPAIIKKTQDTLGRLIQAPSLTDKLLNRPPVQFIQDIVKSVVKNTGLMKGLYSSEELEGAYIKASKENKLLFLKKMITFVSLVIGDHLSVKEGKIAAGSEAEKTNELLQCLAKAINIKPDNDEFVKKTLKKIKSQSDEPEKEKGGRGSREDKRDEKPEKEEKRDRERDKSKDERNKDREESKHSKDREERHKERDKDREERHKDKERDKEKEREEKAAKDRIESKDKDDKRERRKKDEEKDRERDSSRQSREKKESEANDEKIRRHSSSRGKRGEDNDESDAKPKKESSSKVSSKKEEDKKHNRDEDNEEAESKKSRRGRDNRVEEQNGDHDDNEDDKVEQTRLRRPSSAKGGRKVATDENDEDEMALQAAQGNLNNNINNDDMRNVPRPTTARPGAPRKRLTNETEDVTPNSKVVAQSSVIVDKDSESDDDFVVKEQKLQDDQKLPLNGFGGEAGDDDDFDKNGLNKGEHGALVKKILESKEQLEHGSQLNNKKNDSQKPTMQMDAQRKKERERIQKEIDKLKESIQTLTKSSIPLGRTLDFLQEDIDMMQKELGKWRDEYDLHSKALKRQQQEANLALEPYKAALNEVNNSINDQLEKIASVKRKILINEDKISKLIFNIGKRN